MAQQQAMGSDGALLQQHLVVLQEAHDRAEEIRNEIATLKEKTGTSNAVTVPQLLKGDAIPDVTEPEGKPDDPESRLQYHASTPSGERHVPPKTEDGTDTEEQQECNADRRSESPSALELLWIDGATAAISRGNVCNTGSSVSAADGSDAGSWQGVYRNVLHKLNQSRSSRQHLTSGTDVASMLQEARLTDSTSRQSQMTPFARGTGQAAAVAAEATTTEGGIGKAQVLGSMIEASVLKVVEESASNSTPVNGATYTEQPVWHVAGQSGSQDSSNGGSSGSSAQNAAASSASTLYCELYRRAQGHSRLPVVMASSAADLPVQAVLEELDKLLAGQTGRSPAGAAVHHVKDRARTLPGPVGGGAAARHSPAAQGLPRQEQDDPEEDMVYKWVRATQQQRGVSRSNSDSGLLSEEMCDRSWCSSSCSMQQSRRRSNNMPSHNQGNFPPEDDNSDKASKIRHSKKGGSADLRDEIISHLKMAAAFRPQPRSGSQPAATPGTSASPSTAAAVAGGSVQHNVSLVDLSNIDRYLNGASTPPAAAAGSKTGSPQVSSCRSTPASGPRQASEAEQVTPPGLRNIRTDRAHGTAARPAAGSATAVLSLPQRSESPNFTGTRSAQLYHKLLRGSLHGSSSGSSRSTPASSPTKQYHSSQASAGLDGQGSGGKVKKASALGKEASAAGFPGHTLMSPNRQHKLATDDSCELTCSSCGSLVLNSTTPFSAVAAQHSNLSPHRAQAPNLAGGISVDAMPAAAAAQNADRPASPADPVVAFASLSLSALLGDRNRAYPSGGSDSLAGTSVPALNASYSSYSSKAASKKPLAERTVGTSMQAASNKQAVASPPRKLMAATKAASPSRGGYASSASKRVSRVKAVAAVRGSAVGAANSTRAAAASPAGGVGGVDGAMVTAISCRQLLQEAALHQAFNRVSGGADEAQNVQQNKEISDHDAASAPQQSHLKLQALTVEDSHQPASRPTRHCSTGRPQDSEDRSRSECSSSGGSSQLTDVLVYRLQATNDAAGSSPAAAASAAAALQTLAAGAGRRGASVSPSRGASSRPTAGTKHSRSNSAGLPSRPSASPGVSRSCSARSKASMSSNASGSSPRVWRPGGQRTSAKDDCKKLQAYLSARRALIGAGGNSGTTPAAPPAAAAAAAAAATFKQPAIPHRPAAGSPGRSAPAIAGKTGPPKKAASATSTTRAQKAGPAAISAATKTKATPAAAAAATRRLPQPVVAEQGVQADMSVAAGLDSASSLISKLKRKLQPNSRQSSPGRMQAFKNSPPAASAAPSPLSPILQQKVSAAALSPAGQSSPTTSQVEEAIKAAQLALLQRRWQISQLRKAMQQHDMTPHGSASSSSSLAVTAGGCRITAGSRAAVATVKGSADESVHGAEFGSDLASASDLAAVPGLSASASRPNTAVEPGQDAPPNSEGFYATQASTMIALIRQRHSTGGAAPQIDPAGVGTAIRVSAGGHSTQGSPVQRPSSNSSPFAAESYHSTGTIGGMRGLTVSPPAWSAPRRVSSSGMTADELIKYYRRSSAAETAEAAAVAAAEGAGEGSMVPGAMNLDAMLRAYNALSRRRNSVDKSAALAALMSNIVAVAGVQALEQIISVAEEDEQDAVKQGDDGGEQQDKLDAPQAPVNTSMAIAPAAADDLQDSSAVTPPARAAGVADDALAAAAAEEGSGLVIVSMTVNAMSKQGAIKLKDTATGKAVLAGIDGSNLTVHQAVHWLKVGLTRIPGTTSGGGAGPGQQEGASSAAGPAATSLRSASPATALSSKSRPHSRSCSPFNCFAPVGRLSEDDSYDQGYLQGHRATVPGRHQQPGDGVHFEMDASNQLLMVVPQQLSAGGLPSAATAGGCPVDAPVYKYDVTGVSLLGASSRSSSHGGRFSSSGSNASLSLELMTCAGRHRIDLASERDWAGLLAGLNAMLLLREAQASSKLAKQLEDVPISDIAWSSAIEGVEV